MTMTSIDPATGLTIRTFDETTDDELESAVRAADEEFRRWRRLPWSARADRLARAADLLRAGAGDHARLMAGEMGKPITQGRSEAEKCAWVCEHYAEHAERYLRDEPVAADADASFVTFQPLGVLLAVMPWNFPYWQVFRCAAPALMAGNVVLLKHASNVSGCALEIQRLLREAGLPEGAFRTVLIGSDRVGRLIDHPLVRAVTVTGSVSAGRAIASRAGAALKKTVLELGGSDPYIVLADADLPAAVETCVAARLTNSGQSCIAAKRFIVVDEVADEFARRFVERMGRALVGDPLDPATEVGPLARSDLRDELHEQVRRTVAAGAVLALGGEMPEGPGAFYPPTVLTGVTPGMAAFDEETFGPVAAIVGAKDEAEAVARANASPFGLGAAIFSRDADRGSRLAAVELEAGCCFVNGAVRSDPRLPFGGVKDSGYGRELGSFGIREFVNVKSVVVDRAAVK